MKILFGYVDSHVIQLCKANPIEYGVIRKRKNSISDLSYNISIYDYPSLDKIDTSNIALDGYERSFSKILWDPISLMLYERDYFAFKFETLSLRSIKISNFIFSRFYWIMPRIRD